MSCYINYSVTAIANWSSIEVIPIEDYEKYTFINKIRGIDVKFSNGRIKNDSTVTLTSWLSYHRSEQLKNSVVGYLISTPSIIFSISLATYISI